MGPAFVSLVAMHCIIPVKLMVDCRDDPNEHEHFVFIIFNCIDLAIYILGVTILENFVSLSGHFTPKVIAGVMLMFLAVPLLIPFRMYVDSFMKCNMWTMSTNMGVPANEPLLKVERLRGDAERNSLEDVASQSGGQDAEESFFVVAYGAVRKLKRGPRRGQDFKLKQALVKVDFWLLFFSFFCRVGSDVTGIKKYGPTW